MTDRYSEAEAVAAVARLTHPQLLAFVQAEIITPIQSDTGMIFRQIDIVRLELLCELSEEFELQEDALGMVISLIDQLHAVRSELRTVLAAIGAEDAAVRGRIAEALHRARTGV